MAARICPARGRDACDPLDILAVSGGAAGGAFGAGVLAGLTRTGRRPRFQLVTGVSTGALIAPFAFLGSAWDDRLVEAYTGGRAAALFNVRKALPGMEAGLFRARALDALIAPFIDAGLLQAVAAAHAEGRRLFVATTDLDRQEACVWDMGRIALLGGRGDAAGALALFRDVLAASASLPGLFPPRLITCESDGQAYQEMHADGGMAAPLFVLPEILLRWPDVGRRLRGARVHLLVNTALETAARVTPGNIPAILVRSFETMLRYSYLQAVTTTEAFCAGAGLPLGIASIPGGGDPPNLVSFETANMREMFAAGLARGCGANPWSFPDLRGPEGSASVPLDRHARQQTGVDLQVDP
ncbi:MAG: patatin-like phospholipase family protein [Caulobacterales bacterium]|nr:patatin-like phospholipase family protein [Caulobacterales bacterium]